MARRWEHQGNKEKWLSVKGLDEAKHGPKMLHGPYQCFMVFQSSKVSFQAFQMCHNKKGLTARIGVS